MEVRVFSDSFELRYALADYPSGASGQAAISAAAKTVLTSLFPENATEIDAKYDAYVSDDQIASSASERDGVLAGELVGRAVMRSMDADFSASLSGAENNGTFKVQWAFMQPWCIAIGPRRRMHGWLLSKRQINPVQEQGWFPLDDVPLPSGYPSHQDIDQVLFSSGAGTGASFGCLVRPENILEMSINAAEMAHLEFEDTARLLALVSMSMADASILAWTTKLYYHTPTSTARIRNLTNPSWIPPRPECYTDEEDTGSLGDFIDLHSAVAGAGFAVLARVFGNNPTFPLVLLSSTGGGEQITDLGYALFMLLESRARGGSVFNTSVQEGARYGTLAGNWIYNECLPREAMTTVVATATTLEDATTDPDDNSTTGTYEPYTEPPWIVSELTDLRRLGFLLACCLACILVTSLACCCCLRAKRCKCCCRRCKEGSYEKLPPELASGVEMGVV